MKLTKEENKEQSIINLNRYQYDKKEFNIFKEHEPVGIYNNEFELTGKVLLELNNIAVVQIVEVPFYTTVIISLNNKDKNKKGKYKIITNINAIRDLTEYIEKGKLDKYQKKVKKQSKVEKEAEAKHLILTEAIKRELEQGVHNFFLHVPNSNISNTSDRTLLEQYFRNTEYRQKYSSPTPYNIKQCKDVGATKIQISLLCGVTPNKLTALEKVFDTKDIHNLSNIDVFRFLWTFVNFDKASITTTKVEREFMLGSEQKAEAFLKERNIDLSNWQLKIKYTLKEIFEKVKENLKKTISNNPLEWSSFVITYEFIRESIGVSKIDFLRFKETYLELRDYMKIELSKMKSELIASDEKLRKDSKKHHKIQKQVKQQKEIDYSNPYFIEKVTELYKENPYLTKEALRAKLDLSMYNFILLLRYNKDVAKIVDTKTKENQTVKLTPIKDISRKYPKMSLAEKAKKLNTTVEELNKTLDKYNLLQEKLQIDEERIITEIMIYLFKQEKFIKRDIAEKCGLTLSRFETYCLIYGFDYVDLVEKAEAEVKARKTFK